MLRIKSQFVGALAAQMCSDSKHSYKMWKSRTSQCVPTTQQKFMGAQNCKTCPKHFYKMLKSRMSVCATHKSWNCTQNFFCKSCSWNTSEMRLNFTGNSFFCTHKSGKCAQNVFINLQADNFPTMSEVFFVAHCCISMLWPGNCLNRENYVLHIFQKITKLCFV